MRTQKEGRTDKKEVIEREWQKMRDQQKRIGKESKKSKEREDRRIWQGINEIIREEREGAIKDNDTQDKKDSKRKGTDFWLNQSYHYIWTEVACGKELNISMSGLMYQNR